MIGYEKSIIAAQLVQYHGEDQPPDRWRIDDKKIQPCYVAERHYAKRRPRSLPSPGHWRVPQLFVLLAAFGKLTGEDFERGHPGISSTRQSPIPYPRPLATYEQACYHASNDLHARSFDPYLTMQQHVDTHTHASPNHSKSRSSLDHVWLLGRVHVCSH